MERRGVWANGLGGGVGGGGEVVGLERGGGGSGGYDGLEKEVEEVVW